jgi:hypothetical protein
MHSPPLERYFCKERGKAVRPTTSVTKTNVKGTLTAILGTDKRNVNIQMNMHAFSTIRALFLQRAWKSCETDHSTRHVGYVDKYDRMMNSSLLADGPRNEQKAIFSSSGP